MQVTVTFAQSIDGRIATITGESRWISGEETLRLAHELRGSHEGVLVGVGTVMRDDPELTCRLPRRRSPARIVLDSKLSIPRDSKLVRTAADRRTLLLTTSGAREEDIRSLRESGAEVVPCESNPDGSVDIASAVGELERMGVETLLVEGGSAVITSFLRSGLVGRLIVVLAPILIGEGTQAVGDLGVRRLSEAKRLKTVKIRRLGRDLSWELEPDG